MDKENEGGTNFKAARHLSGHGGPVYGLSRGRTKTGFFSASSDGFIAEWDIHSDQSLPFSVKVGIPMFSVLYEPESDLLFAGNGKGGVHVLSTFAKEELRLLHHHESFVFALALSKKYNRFISGSGDGTISVNELDGLKHIETIRLSAKKIRYISFSPDEDAFAVSCGDGSIQLIRTETLEPLANIEAHDLSSNVAIFKENGNILSGGRDAFLKEWHPEGGGFREKISIPAHNFALYDLVISPDGTRLVSVSRDKTIKVWNIEPDKPLIRLDAMRGGHKNSVNRALWINNQTFVTAGDDKTCIVWSSDSLS